MSLLTLHGLLDLSAAINKSWSLLIKWIPLLNWLWNTVLIILYPILHTRLYGYSSNALWCSFLGVLKQIWSQSYWLVESSISLDFFKKYAPFRQILPSSLDIRFFGCVFTRYKYTFHWALKIISSHCWMFINYYIYLRLYI